MSPVIIYNQSAVWRRRKRKQSENRIIWRGEIGVKNGKEITLK